MKNANTELERLADAITLLKRGPHTAAELGSKLGVQAASARRWCNVWQDKGHVKPLAVLVKGQPAKAWKWA